MRKWLTISLGLAGLVTASAASAQTVSPGFGFGMMMGGAPGYYMQGMFPGRAGIIDLNDDGQVSAEEAAAAAEQVFSLMDLDGDGQLVSEEYLSLHFGYGMGWNPVRQAEVEEQKAEKFAAMDADGDKVVTKAEFLDIAKAHHDAADSDGDGIVTPWEHRRLNWY